MKKILSIFLLILSQIFCAQADTEHWFAPFASMSNGQSQKQSLYLSTSQAVPFTVKIYNNNAVVYSVQISKGNPATVAIDRSLIFAENPNQKFAPNSMGLHLVADYKFFATLRFSEQNHAEIVTSKGKAALGNEFYTYTPLNNSPEAYTNSTFGITATEDFTTIILNNFSDGISLSNGTSVDKTTTQTVRLNKGQSYIYEAVGNTSVNLYGLAGVHISSDKPITITNGDYLYIAPNKKNVDIYMDQSVPVQRYGDEFILMKGNGNLNTGMEVGIVLASEDNTNILINENSNPVTIAKKGDYAVIPSSEYLSKNPAVDAYSMHLKTDKKVLVYQLLAGVDAGSGVNSYASGGMNLIPPLACLLPKKIDELALVDQVPYIDGNNFNTRLNIVTQSGSSVKVNGVLLAGNNGPFPVAGTTAWETYTVNPVSGNITIESTNAVTAGIAGGSGAVGFGGYFAGFNSSPVVSKGGDCDSGNTTLEVDDTFNEYQWYKNGLLYTGADANKYKINPDGPGFYYVKIIKAGCGSLDSPSYKLLACTVNSSISQEVGNCGQSYTFIPKFTQSAQAIDITSITLVQRPTNGTATLDTSGNIIYTFTNNSATSDTFSYRFSGTAQDFPDSELVTVKVTAKPLVAYDGTATACVNGTGQFYINQVKLTDNTKATYRYFTTPAAAETLDASKEITTFPYTSPAGTVYTRITDEFGCFTTAKITLKNIQPIINLSNYNTVNCDDDLDGQVNVKFSDITPLIISDYNTSTVQYSLFQDFHDLLDENWAYTAPTDVYVRASSPNGCIAVKDVLHFRIGNKTPITADSISENVCDENLDGTETIDLKKFRGDFTSDSSIDIRYFANLDDAKKNTNELRDTNITLSGAHTYYLRLKGDSYCANIARLNVNFRTPKRSTILKDQQICQDAVATLDVGTGFDAILWSTNETTPTITVPVGSYWVDLSSNGCIYRQYIKVTEAPKPSIDAIKISGSTVTIAVSGGNMPYKYSLDGSHYQDSNVFSNLSRSMYKVYVISADRCSPVTKEFSVINLVNAFTPNGDGINDTLDYSDLSTKSDVKFSIFDRYGKKLFESGERQNYVWDGTVDGRIVPTGTYWYLLQWKEYGAPTPIQYSGWVFVKNH